MALNGQRWHASGASSCLPLGLQSATARRCKHRATRSAYFCPLSFDQGPRHASGEPHVARHKLQANSKAAGTTMSSGSAGLHALHPVGQCSVSNVAWAARTIAPRLQNQDLVRAAPAHRLVALGFWRLRERLQFRPRERAEIVHHETINAARRRHRLMPCRARTSMHPHQTPWRAVPALVGACGAARSEPHGALARWRRRPVCCKLEPGNESAQLQADIGANRMRPPSCIAAHMYAAMRTCHRTP